MFEYTDVKQRHIPSKARHTSREPTEERMQLRY
jgi:hypothetical protein